jgi:hypothetical protein
MQASVIEGACRRLIGDRLDTTGARWGLEGAEAILTLRAVMSNGDHPDVYWRFHLAREHQRLYPGTAQGEYTLWGLSRPSPGTSAPVSVRAGGGPSA